MSNEKTFKVVYNDCYGGFDISKKALAEYNRRMSTNFTYAEQILQSDPVLIELVETMGKEVNSHVSRLKIKEFPIKYKGFLIWSEYDGKENVSIDYDRYLIYHIKVVMDDKFLSSHEKMELIQGLYQEYDSRTKRDQ